MGTPQGPSAASLVSQHLWPGLLLVALFALLAPLFQSAGIPTFAAILVLEVFFLAPFVAWKLGKVARDEQGSSNPMDALQFRPPPQWKHYLWLVPLGLVLAIAGFEVLRPVDEALKAALWPFLPDWHYAKDLEHHDASTLVWLFSIAIVADGFIGPVAEELYFRGYLLPRMQHLRLAAPLLNGLLFALYHFWQPMNYPSLMVASTVLALFAWWRRDFRVALGIHCAMNTLGHTLGLVGLLAPPQ